MMDASAPMGGKGAETEPTQTMGEITRPPKRGMVKLSLRKRTKTHLQRVNGPVVDTEIFTKRNNFAKETEAFDDQVAKMVSRAGHHCLRRRGKRGLDNLMQWLTETRA